MMIYALLGLLTTAVASAKMSAGTNKDWANSPDHVFVPLLCGLIWPLVWLEYLPWAAARSLRLSRQRRAAEVEARRAEADQLARAHEAEVERFLEGSRK